LFVAIRQSLLVTSLFSLEQSSDSKKDSKRTSSEWNGIDSLMVVLPFEGWLQKNKCSTALRTFYTLPIFRLSKAQTQKKTAKEQVVNGTGLTP